MVASNSLAVQNSELPEKREWAVFRVLAVDEFGALARLFSSAVAQAPSRAAIASA